MTKLLFLDLETTGIRPDRRGGIEEIALFKSNSAIISWVAPDANTYASRSLLDTVLQALNGHVVVGHNVSFDLHHLMHEASRFGLPGPSLCAIDTLGLARQLQVPADDYSLGALLRLFGKLPKAPLHSARVDAAATRDLLWQLVAYGNLMTLSDAGARPVHWATS
jgi:DNA polymerase III epsilon subunit-like protein